MPRLARYGPGARVYDVVSGERFVYRVGRVAGIDALRLSPGDAVLDLGCGTGLNFPLLIEKVGPGGSVIGVDRSAAMLQVAKDKVARNGWDNVRLVEADVAELSWPAIRQAVPADRTTAPTDRDDDIDSSDSSGHSHGNSHSHSQSDEDSRASDSDSHEGADADRVDAAIATYAMSVFDDWRPAWNLMRSALAPGGRISIVDMARPVGVGALLTPLAVLACAVGGADLDAAPWRELEATGSDVTHSLHRSGHIHAVAGSFP